MMSKTPGNRKRSMGLLEGSPPKSISRPYKRAHSLGDLKPKPMERKKSVLDEISKLNLTHMSLPLTLSIKQSHTIPVKGVDENDLDLDPKESVDCVDHLKPIPAIVQTRSINLVQTRSVHVLASIHPNQKASIHPNQLASMHSNQVASMDSNQVASIHPNQLASMDSKVPKMSTESSDKEINSNNSKETSRISTPSDAFSDTLDEDGLNELMAKLEATCPPSEPTKKYHAFLVLQVTRSTDPNTLKSQMHLKLLDEVNSVEQGAYLQDGWEETPVFAGDQIHLNGTFDSSGNFLINSAQGFVILFPSKLLSCTTVSESFGCLRRPSISARVRPPGQSSRAMMVGNLAHELCERAFTVGSTSGMESHIDELLAGCAEDLYSAQTNEVEVRMDLAELLPSIREFFSVNVASSDEVKLGNPNGKTIHSVIDIEETIRSPTYGIKGVIDASGMAHSKSASKSRLMLNPIELKTGKTKSLSHRAQTTLYTLLMSDFYEVPIQAGQLAYVRTAELNTLPFRWDDARNLLQQRNRLAYYLAESLHLPEMVSNLHTCKYCPVKPHCMVYAKVLNDQVPKVLESTYFDATCHLTPAHLEFLASWEAFLTKEEKVSKSIHHPWNTSVEVGERRGLTIGHLLISNSKGESSGSFRHSTTLERVFSTHLSILHSGFNVGDPISISVQEGAKTVAIGFVTGIEEKAICISTDRPLNGLPSQSADFNMDLNQTFLSKLSLTSNAPKTIYRIDKEEYANGMGMPRNNLFDMFIQTGSKLRDLIVDGRPPLFDRTKTLQPDLLDGMHLNDDQTKTLLQVVQADDYALLLGMPGTGKSTTMACLVEYLVKSGYRVLITSYTHAAVDNVLFKLKSRDIDFLRLGNSQKFHPEIREMADKEMGQVQSVDDLKRLYQSKRVVATTCLGINHPIFLEETFDYCIVDEASQISLPVCLGPIRHAPRFVLVGDHYQLPPLIRANLGPREIGSSSLFKYLCQGHPESTVTLKTQYRMNDEIMSLSNTLIYNNRLICGNDAVAGSRLGLVSQGNPSTIIHSSQSTCPSNADCWIMKALNPNLPVVFLNTDRVPAEDDSRGAKITNKTEAELVRQIVSSLLAMGLDAKDIGVIAPYRSQIKLLQETLEASPGIEVDSVDRFQGRDKPCIIISFTRSNPNGQVGELLKDWRRLNVAITRAKSKLIMVGSLDTLTTVPLFTHLLRAVKVKGALVDAPPKAHEIHSM